MLYCDTIPFVPDVQEAFVIKVYDGDTFTIGFFQPYSKAPFRMSVRLRGIDCEEIRDPNKRKKIKAKLAQRYLSELILGKTVTLNDISMEKYGRLLANVYFDGVFINQLMVDKHFAVLYMNED